MTFRIRGLSPTPFRHLFWLGECELAAVGVRRLTVDTKPGFPDRVEMRDLNPGETVLLLNYTHQPADTPYRASHATFVLEGAHTAYDAVGEVPEVMRVRPISLRGFSGDGQMLDADLIEGRELEPAVARMMSDERIAYLHAHYAKRGCYAARIERR